MQPPPLRILVRLNLGDAEAWLVGMDTPEVQDAIQEAVDRKKVRMAQKVREQEEQEALAAKAIKDDEVGTLTDDERRRVLRKLRHYSNRGAYRMYKNWLLGGPWKSEPTDEDDA